MAENVGLNVREGESSGVSPLVEASRHNIGLLMERERGIPNVPVLVTSLQEDRQAFGSNNKSFYGPYVAQSIYGNAGSFGANIYGCRIVGTGSAAASATLNSGAQGDESFIKTVTTGISAFATASLIITNPSGGDIFTITVGSTVISSDAFPLDGSGSVASIVDDLFTKIQALVSSSDSDIIPYTWEKAPNSASLIVTHLTSNDNLDPIMVSSTSGASGTIATITAGRRGQADPGTWANGIMVTFLPPGHADNDEAGQYLVTVTRGSAVVETHVGATLVDLFATINGVSNFILANVANIGLSISDKQELILSSGVYVSAAESDFSPDVTEPSSPKGLAAFSGVDVQLIINAEFQTDNSLREGRDFCQQEGNKFFIGNTAFLATQGSLEATATVLQQSGPSFIAVYNHWIQVSDSFEGTIWIPAIGAIAGAAYIRTPGLNQNEVFTPPAGEDSSILGAIDHSPKTVSKARETILAKRLTINSVRFVRGRGYIVSTSRTMATNPLYHSIHIRRQTSFYLDTLQQNFTFLEQKPNTPELGNDAVTSLTSYFRGEYQRAGLENSVPFNQAFRAVYEVPSSTDRKRLNITVEWIPTEATETVVISLNRNDGVLLTQELTN